jgi:hypothetical protein
MIVISHGSIVICRDGHVIYGKVAAILQTGSPDLAGMVFAKHCGSVGKNKSNPVNQ